MKIIVPIAPLLAAPHRKTFSRGSAARLPVLMALLVLALSSYGTGFAQNSIAPTPEGNPVGDFNKEGLVLWLDASDLQTVIRDQAGVVLEWKDKSGRSNHAERGDLSSKAILVEAAMNNRPVLRFTGKEFLLVPKIRATPGKVALFVVTQRSPEQATDQKWQRLISSDGGTANDDRSPSFNLCGLKNGSGNSFGPTVVDKLDDGVTIGPLSIGRNQRLQGNHFHGDIAEVLVFDREFVSEDAIQSVIQYLSSKWKAKSTRAQEGWTRVGALGETPQRKNEQYPLSDQDNKGGWFPYDVMTDEFNGDKLDSSKWWDFNPRWLGRKPALFLPHNVEVREGKLRLTMRNENVPNAPKGYHTFTSAAVQSKTRILYGYLETRAKPMKSAGSSAFWLYYHDREEHTEIDIFEIGGGAEGFERKYNMGLHVFHSPAKAKRWGTGGTWSTPWNLTDDYHVYGLDWNEKELAYYVDGVVVRRVENRAWHQPLTLNFDSETMPSWFGLPDPKDLPSTFEIDYVRAWKKSPQSEEPIPGFTKERPAKE